MQEQTYIDNSLDVATASLVQWSGGKFDASNSHAQGGRHRLQDLDLFSDEALIDLLDRYPRNRLQAWTMGTDPLHREDWKAVDTAGLSGKDLLAAVKSGRLWYNILRVDQFDQRYRQLVDRLYAQMANE